MNRKAIATIDGQKVNGRLTTNHAASSYNQPVFVDDDDRAYNWSDIIDIDIQTRGANEMTIAQAVEFARKKGKTITGRGIRKAAASGYILGARKLGRDWLIPRDGFVHYLNNRPKRGPVAKMRQNVRVE